MCSLVGSDCKASFSAKCLRSSSSIFPFSKMITADMEPENTNNQNNTSDTVSLQFNPAKMRCCISHINAISQGNTYKHNSTMLLLEVKVRIINPRAPTIMN